MEEVTNFSELGELAEMGIWDAIYCCFEGVKGFNEVDPIRRPKDLAYYNNDELVCVTVQDKAYCVNSPFIERCTTCENIVICVDVYIMGWLAVTIHSLICPNGAVFDFGALNEEIQKIKNYCSQEFDYRKPRRAPAAAFIANALLKHIKSLESENNYHFSKYWRYVFQTFFGDEWGLIQIPIDDTLKAVNESFAPEYRAARKPAGFPATCQVEAPTDANDGAPGIDERRQEAINKLVAIGMNKDKAAEAVNALQKKANEHNGIALGRFVVDVYDEQNIMKSLFLKAFAPIAREYYGKTEKDRGFSLVNITTHRYSN